METEIKVKTPGIKITKAEIREIIEDKAMLITAVITAAAETRSHLNVE
jgi:hypothetical protein